MSGDVELWMAVDGDAESNLSDVVAGLVDVGLVLEAAEVEERRDVMTLR